MPHGKVESVIPARAEEVFQLLHDYDRRLEWDTLLQAAYLTDGATIAELGAASVCKGKHRLGGLEFKTVYITFKSPDVAAVKLVNRPPLFESFAASIRHQNISDNLSRVTYQYNFVARPKCLRWLLHPLLNALFRIETRKRLSALAKHFDHCK